MARSWGNNSRKSNDWQRDNNRWNNDRDNNNKWGWNNNNNNNDNKDDSNSSGWFKNWDSTITKLMMDCQKAVTNTIKFGKFSDYAIKKAVGIVESYSKKIGDLLSKDAPPDTQGIDVKVEASGAAVGNNAEVNAHVKLGVFDIDDSAKLVVGTAESYAASEDGHKFTYVNAFSSVSGVDTGDIFSYHHTGRNFEKAVSGVVAVDWQDVLDKNLVTRKYDNFYSKYKKDIGPGQTIKASTDVYIEADNSARVDQGIKSLAVDDFISTLAYADASVS